MVIFGLVLRVAFVACLLIATFVAICFTVVICCVVDLLLVWSLNWNCWLRVRVFVCDGNVLF